MTISIYHDDCINGMKQLPDNSIDMVLTDPPYGTTRNKWDVTVNMDSWWKEVKRIAKPHAAILMFSQMPFSAYVVMSNPKMFRYEWIYKKTGVTGFLNAHRMPLKCHENVLVFYDKLPIYNPQMIQGKAHGIGGGTGTSNYGSFIPNPTKLSSSYFPRDVIEFKSRVGKSLHPTQKPMGLCEYFIKTYSNENDTVLDTFMGSGTTGVAARNTHRSFVGYEIDDNFFKISEDRLKVKHNVRNGKM